MVRTTPEDRDLLQDTENRMQNRGYAPDYRRPAGKLHRTLLYRRLADFLAHYSAAPISILQRQSPTSSPAVVFTDTELRLLEQTMPSSRKTAPRDLKFFVTAVARLGGYLDRSRDAPPGTTVIWRGFERLRTLVDGFEMANLSNNTKLVGN